MRSSCENHRSCLGSDFGEHQTRRVPFGEVELVVGPEDRRDRPLDDFQFARGLQERRELFNERRSVPRVRPKRSIPRGGPHHVARSGKRQLRVGALTPGAKDTPRVVEVEVRKDDHVDALRLDPRSAQVSKQHVLFLLHSKPLAKIGWKEGPDARFEKDVPGAPARIVELLYQERPARKGNAVLLIH